MGEVTKKLRVIRVSKPSDGKCTLIAHVPYLVRDLVDPENRNLELKKQFKIDWKCNKCYQGWSESITKRKRYQLCPSCQERKVSKKCIEKDCCKSAIYNFENYKWGSYCHIY